ncbi:MAG: two-component regulator propeller domain-containing protein, partial [Bacteroidota bacterium]
MKAFITLSLLLFSTTIYAQFSPASVENIARNIVPADFEGGFNGHTIYDIHEDRNGLLWIASADGLFQFDGRHFREAKQFPRESMGEVLSLSSWGDSILAGTSKGLFIYSHTSQEVSHFSADSSLSPDNILNNRIESMMKDEAGIWMGSWFGVSFLDAKRHQFHHYPLSERVENPQYGAAVHALGRKEGKIWLGTWAGEVYS